MVKWTTSAPGNEQFVEPTLHYEVTGGKIIFDNLIIIRKIMELLAENKTGYYMQNFYEKDSYDYKSGKDQFFIEY